jgi:hypothetical protein
VEGVYYYTILPGSISPYTEEITGGHHCGFRRNGSTADQIICILQILKRQQECNETVHKLFTDFKKAYDSVAREVLDIHRV